MPKEYIERDVVLSNKWEVWSYDPSDPDPVTEVVSVSSVMHIPAADVAPVRHGRWHRFMKGSGQSGNTLICSDAFQCTVCKESFWNKSNYCPNCGAKMDEGQDE